MKLSILESGFSSVLAILIFVGVLTGTVAYTQKDKLLPQPSPTMVAQATVAPSGTAEPSPSPLASPSSSPTSSPKASGTPKPSTTPKPTPTTAPVASSNTPPSAGYSRQQVTTDVGTFTVSIISADLGSTRVIVDTASASDCTTDCPTMSLADYVSRNGAYAGVNGSYFCPKDYASCAEKKDSFDTLAMNKDKYYFNSANNVYSTIPTVIFGSGWTRFVKQSLEWGRDTGVDGILANYPLLTFNDAIEFTSSSDGKLNNKGGRSFVGSTGSTVYIGVVHNATVAEAAHVMKALGIHNSLNLDNGGSTALWYNGYKAGPGRNLPNVILFVKK